MTSCQFNAVVPGTQICTGGEKVHVKVGVVVLLKVCHLHLGQLLESVEADQLHFALHHIHHRHLLGFDLLGSRGCRLLILKQIGTTARRLPLSRSRFQGCQTLCKHLDVPHHWYIHHGSVEISRTKQKVELEFVIHVKSGCLRETLGSTPKGSCDTTLLVGHFVGFGEEVDQIADRLREFLLKDIECHLNTSIIVSLDHLLEHRKDAFHLFQLHIGSTQFGNTSEEWSAISLHHVQFLGWIHKIVGELCQSPFNTVLDEMRKIAQSTHRNTTLGRIVLLLTVGRSHMRNDHLRVCLGAHGTTL
mmetsp:Transcript_8522/g.26422  ORF Transcript_8522/g.26422 Transcript_8522/m.26422 type:complete len:303 (-) Transcript_8522:1958-2866(-)